MLRGKLRLSYKNIMYKKNVVNYFLNKLSIFFDVVLLKI